MTQYRGVKINCSECTQDETLACHACNGHGYYVECIEEADVPPVVAVLGVLGYYAFRAFLVVGLVCFAGVAVALVAGGFIQ
jgi:hypothetical protein